MPIFELGLAIPVKSHVWKFGWIGWAFQELSFEFSVEAETPY